ncbi:MAG: hypothetical protein H7Y28_10145 [Rhodoferax sp.]|nr:hypothetical protein [Rhodoferax sp.]
MLKFSIERPRRSIALAALLLSASAIVWAQAVGTVQQDRQPTWQASQAATTVPPVGYQSVFSDLPKGVESTALDWKAANANVGQFKRGHADLVKWEQEQAEKARKKPDTAPKGMPAPSPSGGQP